jgi:hypothetical protein
MTDRASSRFFGSPEALRRMIAGQELAARASSAAAPMLTAEESFDAALDLRSLCSARLQDPPDAVRLREVAQTRVAWKKLKARFAR